MAANIIKLPLAVGQVLIYVGAVMVFMIYVIMILDNKDSSIKKPFTRYTLMMAPLFLIMAILIGMKFINGENPLIERMTQEISFDHFSKLFLSEYWFYFELSSVLLLVATVAAITVLKKQEKNESEEV